MTSVAWNRYQSIIRTRDGINEATHPPVKDLEIQFEFIRVDQRHQIYTESILFPLGFIRDDPSVNTTRYPGHKHGTIGDPEACLSQLSASLLPFPPGWQCLSVDRYTPSGPGRHHFGTLRSHQWLGRWYIIRFWESRLVAHELLRSIRPTGYASFVEGLD